MSLFAQQPVNEFKVTGMHCEKCVARVKGALENIDGAVKVEVSLADEQAVVTGDIDTQAALAAVQELGFGAQLA